MDGAQTLLGACLLGEPPHWSCSSCAAKVWRCVEGLAPLTSLAMSFEISSRVWRAAALHSQGGEEGFPAVSQPMVQHCCCCCRERMERIGSSGGLEEQRDTEARPVLLPPAPASSSVLLLIPPPHSSSSAARALDGALLCSRLRRRWREGEGGGSQEWLSRFWWTKAIRRLWRGGRAFPLRRATTTGMSILC